MARRKSSRKSRDFDDDQEAYDDDRPDWKAELIPEDVVPTRLRSEFRQSGYRCRRCDFTTGKTGFSGKQSLRAHQKVHVRDRRVSRSAFVPQLIWLVFSVVAIATIAFLAPTVTPLGTVNLVMGSTVVAASLAISIPLIRLTNEALETFDNRQISRVSRLITASRGYTILALAGGLAGFYAWYWLTALSILLYIGLYAATGIAKASQQSRRGKFRSSGYGGMLKPRSEEADWSLSDHQSRLVRLVFSGNLNPFKARGKLRRHFESLGLLRAWERGKLKRAEQAKRRRRQVEERKRKEALRMERQNRRKSQADSANPPQASKSNRKEPKQSPE